MFFTAATGLGRVFVQEEERGTALALRLCARATTVWAGKFAANLLLLLALTALAVPMLLALLNARPENGALLFCVLLLGEPGDRRGDDDHGGPGGAGVGEGRAAGGLVVSASGPAAARGRARDKAALGVGNPGGRFGAGAGDLQVLGSYGVIAVTASLLLFDFVWND
jgi:hypothetical protein